MDNIIDSLLQLGVGGVFVALIYVVVMKLNAAHEKERKEQDTRHLAEIKESRMALERISSSFNDTVREFNKTLTDVRLDLAELKK